MWRGDEDGNGYRSGGDGGEMRIVTEAGEVDLFYYY